MQMIRGTLAIMALSAGAALSAAVAQSAAPAAWTAAHPMTEVSVKATDKAHLFLVSARITDAQTAATLAAPSFVAEAGVPAGFVVGANPGVSLRFSVTVDSSGSSARYRSEILKDGKIQSGYSGVLYVAR
jgi:hypothetical protein